MVVPKSIFSLDGYREDLEYGDGEGMYCALSGDNLTLTDGSSCFLRYDFGWRDSGGNDWAKLESAFTRQRERQTSPTDRIHSRSPAHHPQDRSSREGV
jgi:hypothetical protein